MNIKNSFRVASNNFNSKNRALDSAQKSLSSLFHLIALTFDLNLYGQKLSH